MVALNGKYTDNGADIGDSDSHYAADGIKPGKAYGLSDREIDVPGIRDAVGTPADVELSVSDIDNYRWDPALRSIADDARSRGIRYVSEVTAPGVSNGEGASEIAAIFNQGYQSDAFDEGEHFRGAIVFEKNGKYAFRE